MRRGRRDVNLRALLRGPRTKAFVAGIRRRAKRGRAIVTSRWLRQRIRFSRRSLVGEAPVAVSLTSHGKRVQEVAITIESIGAGAVRPRRLILWLDDQRLFGDLPPALRSQQQRGLEVCLTDNYGPHTKYFPYVTSLTSHELPLVTADDDIIYPRYWLRRLVRAFSAHPDVVSCYRANVVRLDGDALAPYDAWPRSRDTVASVVRFGTGVSGVIYPPAMLTELAARGDVFRATTPRADDVWLHWVALQTGRKVRQLAARPRHFAIIPGSQADGLVVHNVGLGGNDEQIRALYTAADVATLRRAGA
jgi:hypothetical protein